MLKTGNTLGSRKLATLCMPYQIVDNFLTFPLITQAGPARDLGLSGVLGVSSVTKGIVG